MTSGNTLDICTLGPEGTDSENAATLIKQEFDLLGKIILHESFQSAYKEASRTQSLFLIPAAYVDFDDNNNFNEAWSDFNFRIEASTEMTLWKSVVFPLKEMCVARNPECDAGYRNLVCLHPATSFYADKYLPSSRRLLLKNKPKVVELCRNGLAEFCIGTVDVVKRFPNLEIIERFAAKMCWTLYFPKTRRGNDFQK